MTRLSLAFLACAALAASAAAAPVAGPVVRYAGHTVYRCPGTLDAAAVDALGETDGVDLWSSDHSSFDVRVRDYDAFEAMAKATGLTGTCDVFIRDLQETIDAVEEEDDAALAAAFSGADIDQSVMFRTGAAAAAADPFFNDFQRYDAIIAKLKSWTADFPKIASLIPSIGTSHEGRALTVIKITGDAASTKPKESVFIQGGQHAREWIGPATAMFFANELISNYGKDAEITELMNSFVFYILPVMNPDGYEYSATKDRMWRKNRRDNGKNVFGVDLNRNWSDHWGQGGSSASPSSDTYKGPADASEPEVQAVQNFVLTLPNRRMGLDLHAYGQLILRNFGWTNKAGPNEARLKAIGDGMRDVIAKTSGTKYTSERAAELYVTTGSTDDWLTDTAGMEGWTIELRDTGKYGFVLPAKEIVPTGTEAWAALRYYLNDLRRTPKSE